MGNDRDAKEDAARLRAGLCRRPLIAAVTVVVAATLLLLYISPGQALTTTVLVGSDWFCDETYQGGTCETTVSQGDTVRWELVEHAHTVIECGDPNDIPASCGGEGRFQSGLLFDGMVEEFEWTFDDAPATHYYYCDLHPDAMRGRIVVAPALTPSPSPSPSASLSPSPTPSPTPTPSPSPPPTTPLSVTASPSPTATPTDSLTPTPAPRISGDADCDGDADEFDAMAVLLGAGDLAVPPCAENADVDCDGDRDPADALAILRHRAGIPDVQLDCTPVGEPLPATAP